MGRSWTTALTSLEAIGLHRANEGRAERRRCPPSAMPVLGSSPMRLVAWIWCSSPALTTFSDECGPPGFERAVAASAARQLGK